MKLTNEAEGKRRQMGNLRTDRAQSMRRSTYRAVFAFIGSRAVHVLIYSVLIAVAASMLLPLLWMVSTSLKTRGGLFAYPPRLIPNPPTLENYVRVFEVQPYARFFVNSMKVSCLSTLGTVLSCALGGFTFARLRFRGRGVLFSILMSTMMVPAAATLIPRFILMRNLGWIDTHNALIVPSWTGGAFGVFLMRQFYKTIPQDLVDAGRIDGASFFAIFFRIFLPLGKPVLATLCVLTFMDSWNNLMDPLIFLNSTKLFTVTLGITLFRGRMQEVLWGPLMAATTLSVVPTMLLFIGAQKHFVQGIVTTGSKG